MAIALSTVANGNTEIAKTIIQQIRMMDPRALMAWGAKDCTAIPEGKQEIGFVLGGVYFKVNGLKHRGYVRIFLMPDDTYTIQIFRIRKYEIKGLQTVENVYCDMLMDVIDGLIER